MTTSTPLAPRAEPPLKERAWTQADGARLQRMREAKGLDAASLAPRLTMSVAQLRQIENNESSLFYSEPIRLAAARKVADFLGCSLFMEEPRALQVAAAAHEAKAEETDQARQVDEARTVSQSLDSREERTSLIGNEGLAPSSRPAATSFSPLVNMSRTGPLPRPKRLVAGLAIGLVFLGAAYGTAQWLMPTRVAVSPKSTTLAAGEPAGQPSTPSISTAAADPKPDQAAGCGPSAAAPSIYRSPPQAVKDAAFVYVVGKPGHVICVTDASGTQWRHVFKDEAGQSFYGQAPWLMASADLRVLQIFFQGRRARAADPASTSLRLLPHSAPT